MHWSIRAALAAALAGCFAMPAFAQQTFPPPIGQPTNAAGVPKFEPDPFWPKPLPGNWILGQVAGIAVAPDQHIWIIHRPRTLYADEKGAQKNPPTTTCCTAAPPVIEFDQEGNVVRAWGGQDGDRYKWPKNEHGIFIDPAGNVYFGGNTDGDQVYKFTKDGKFLMQFGKDDGTKGSNSTTRLGRPAHMMTDPQMNELFVADGYGNHRVIVFDARTGAYKRHWGAYGHKPTDEKLPPYTPTAAPSPQFSNPVHCVRLSHDGLLYVCDRANDRVQVFKTDGTFVKEFRVEPNTMDNGSVWDLVLSEDPAQKYIFMIDGADGEVVTLNREDGKVLTKWGRHGHRPGEFKWVHNIAIDANGNLYTSEVGYGRRVQKFRRVE
jgi:DNA-binding beta-propeller fold protein YncE